MTLTEKDKKLLSGLSILGIITLTYFFVYTPMNNNLNQIKQEISSLEGVLNVYTQKSQNKSKLEAEIKAVRYEIQRNEKLLPSDLRQEEIILLLKKLQAVSGLEFGNLGFAEVVSVTAAGASNPNNAGQSTSNAQNAPQGQKTAQVKIPDGAGIKMEVKTTYKGTYAQVKSLMQKIMEYENKISISDMNYVSTKDGMVSGNLSLTFYGLKNSAVKAPDWERTTESGRQNLFQPFEGYIDQQNKTGTQHVGAGAENQPDQSGAVGKNDFAMTVGPITSDVPTVIMSYLPDKLGKAYVYTDSNKVEDAELQVLKEGNQYYFKFKTGSMAMPKNYDNEKLKFDPSGSAINFSIVSVRRNQQNDVNGVNISIINKTDLDLNVAISNEDPLNPRVKIVNQAGAVNIKR